MTTSHLSRFLSLWMKLTAQDLYKDGIVEEIIPEPVGGAQRAHGVQMCIRDSLTTARTAG